MILVKVDFALLLLDEFNGSVVGDRGIRFHVNGRVTRPMRKPEGYYVFQGLEGNRFAVEIFAPHYLEHSVQIVRGELPPADPVARIRLHRSRLGSFRDCEWVSGTAPPNTTVCAFFEGQATPLQSKISIQDGIGRVALGYSVQRRVGRRFAVGKGAAAETFVITGEADSAGVYTTGDPLKATHDKGSPVIRACMSQSGPDGCFNIPVETGSAAGVGKICYKEKNKWVSV